MSHRLVLARDEGQHDSTVAQFELPARFVDCLSGLRSEEREAGLIVRHINALNMTHRACLGSQAITLYGREQGLGGPMGHVPLDGSDYTNSAPVFHDVGSDGTAWTAGAGSNCIGLDVLSYTDNQVSYQFGGFYGSEPKYTVQPGDTITVTVNGIQRAETFGG